ncbi:DUF1156 domain-containing protein [Actinomycetaceae bacterium MB13-C1-2]|nr:DUF1156 domain-containing protein [Actinomycetaceae bacterium MB13-C1-2]
MSQNTDNQNTETERNPLTTTPKKKLIEVSLPLEAINEETRREGTIRQSKPASLHHWWSRKPHVNVRAAIFAQLVDDPSADPDSFPTPEAQAIERARLHDLMERLSKWENSGDKGLMEEARNEIRRSNGGDLPAVLDPFCGGGIIPLEAQRLGLEAHASDLNPVAVLVTKALVQIPPLVSGKDPVFPDSAAAAMSWSRMEGFAEDLSRYGSLLIERVWAKIGHLYPTVTTQDGNELTVIAWKWARTVVSPNPAHPIRTPLVSTWWLSTNKGKEAYIVPEVREGVIEYSISRDPYGPKGDEDWTIKHGKGAKAVGDATPFSYDYVREEGMSGRIGYDLIAVAAKSESGRAYFAPSERDREAASVVRPQSDLDIGMSTDSRWFSPPAYGYTRFSDLYLPRQLTMLTAFSDTVAEVRAEVLRDATAAGWEQGEALADGGSGAVAYADAIATYLAMAVDKLADLNNSLCSWEPKAQCPKHMFFGQAIPMVWDFAEANPFSGASGSLQVILEGMVRALRNHSFSIGDIPAGGVSQSDAASRDYSGYAVVTDPPYYDMISYSDLSDFFYTWLRRSLKDVYPNLFRTMLTPKSEELVANQYRHGGKEEARQRFVNGFNDVFRRIRYAANQDVPLLIYYAYKQKDENGKSGSSNGWHTLLDGLISGGWEVTATWPMRTERAGRLTSLGANSIASTILLACRPRTEGAVSTTRRVFVATLKESLPDALRKLMQGSIAPVDLAQAAIGPGIAVFSAFGSVREADGSDMSVKDALLLINATLDEVLGEQESDFDPDTRFAVKWYRQYGWGQENSGIADQLARSSDTSIGALERGGIFEAKGGKACLLSPSQLDGDWDASADESVSVWEATIRLAGVMAKDGADKVAELLPQVQTRVNLDAVKELGFLLFHEAEKKKDTKDAILFNGLVSAWGDVNEQARKYASIPRSTQEEFDFDEDGD